MLAVAIALSLQEFHVWVEQLSSVIFIFDNAADNATEVTEIDTGSRLDDDTVPCFRIASGYYYRCHVWSGGRCRRVYRCFSYPELFTPHIC